MQTKMILNFVVYTLVFSLNAQDAEKTTIYNLEYDIINSLYGKSKKEIILNDNFKSSFEIIYFLEYFPSLFDELRGHCIQEDSILSFKDVLNKDEITLLYKKSKNSFLNSSQQNKSIAREKLSTNIKLLSSIDEKENIPIYFISKPIIIGNTSVVIQYSKLEAYIFILKENDKEWDVLCRKILYTKFENPVIKRE